MICKLGHTVIFLSWLEHWNCKSKSTMISTSFVGQSGLSLLGNTNLIFCIATKFREQFGSRRTFQNWETLFYILCFLVIESCFVNPGRNFKKSATLCLFFHISLKILDLAHFKNIISSMLACYWVNMLLCQSAENTSPINRWPNCYLMVIPHRIHSSKTTGWP